MRRVFPHLALATWLGLGALLLTVPPAWGYVDPGTGGFMVQTLVAGAMAAAFVIKTQWRRLRHLLSRDGKADPGDER